MQSYQAIQKVLLQRLKNFDVLMQDELTELKTTNKCKHNTILNGNKEGTTKKQK